MVLSKEEEEALAQTKLSGLRKKINAESWSDNMEVLMKKWGEKAAGLRFMHAHSGSRWKNFANKLSIASILITTLASTISLITANVEDENTQNVLMYTVGGVGLFSSLIQSFKKFYNAEDKAADHSAISKQFGSYYRTMTLQMGMSREDRDPADVLTAWALKEYERLQLESPPLNSKSICLFKEKFKNSEQCYPDVAEDAFIINIYQEDDKEDDKEEKKIVKEEIELIDNTNKKLIEVISNNENLEVNMATTSN
tara:strand:- start:68 stop:829 length:762 start_codon:yes stop_codon:yes gene_type:complete